MLDSTPTKPVGSAQVSGNKIQNIQPSSNEITDSMKTYDGNYVEATHEYRKITDVQATQVSGKCINTNYMGINDAGMDIREAKKVDETFYSKDQATCEKEILDEANKEIAKQEADKKAKYAPEKPEEPEELVEPEDPEDPGDNDNGEE